MVQNCICARFKGFPHVFFFASVSHFPFSFSSLLHIRRAKISIVLYSASAAQENIYATKVSLPISLLPKSLPLYILLYIH
jgi:hypothetical protein